MGTFALMGDFKKLMGWETASSPNPVKQCALLYLFFFFCNFDQLYATERKLYKHNTAQNNHNTEKILKHK